MQGSNVIKLWSKTCNEHQFQREKNNVFSFFVPGKHLFSLSHSLAYTSSVAFHLRRLNRIRFVCHRRLFYKFIWFVRSVGRSIDFNEWINNKVRPQSGWISAIKVAEFKKQQSKTTKITTNMKNNWENSVFSQNT